MEISSLMFMGAWFISGFVNGLTSFGSALVVVPLITPLVPSAMLIPLTVIMVIVISSYMIIIYRSKINFKALIPITIAALPGAIAGGFFLKAISPASVQFFAGIFMLLYVVWQIIPKPEKTYKENIPAAAIAGFSSGFINSTISMGGPPLAIYSLLAGWKKEEIFSTLSVSIVLNCSMASAVHASNGLYTKDMLPFLYLAIPSAIIGLVCAYPLEKKINKALFVKIVLFVIGISGFLCLYRAFIGFYS